MLFLLNRGDGVPKPVLPPSARYARQFSRARRVAGPSTARPASRGAAGRTTKKESKMPKFKFVKKASRRRGRRRARRNMPFQIRRGGRGRFAQSGGTLLARFPKSAKSRSKSGKRRKSSGVGAGTILKAFAMGASTKKRRRKSKSSGKVKRRKAARRSGRKAKRRKNPGRRTTIVQLLGRGPRRRRRSRGRRRNPLHLRRRRSGLRRRRNPGFGLSLGSGMGFVKSLFSRDTMVLVGGGTAGLSASLWGPKLAGHLLWAPLGRGWGGVATSVVTTGLVSGLVSRVVGQRAGQAVLAGGLIGSFAQLLSAINCNWRTQILPLETSLLACALPTVPPQGAAAKLMAAGVPAAQAQALAAGMRDYIPAIGMNGYSTDLSGGVNRLLGGEAAFRAQGGLRDFVNLPAGNVASGTGMDSSAETF